MSVWPRPRDPQPPPPQTSLLRAYEGSVGELYNQLAGKDPVVVVFEDTGEEVRFSDVGRQPVGFLWGDKTGRTTVKPNDQRVEAEAGGMDSAPS